MNLGETIEEKRENFELLDKKAKKWGKVCKTWGLIFSIVVSLMLLTSLGEGGILALIGTLIFCGIFIAVSPIVYYYYGQILCYGYIKVREWFAKKGIGASDVAAAAGGSIAISYFLGGRKSAKIAGVTWLIMLGVVVTVGIFVGLYNFVMVQREMKELGIA